jgi:hypothetical protein
MSDHRGSRGVKRSAGVRTGNVIAVRVTVIGLADAQGGVALEDGVRVGSPRDRVEGSGSHEGEVEKGEQKKVTSVDRHSEGVEGTATRLGNVQGEWGALYRQRAGWNALV